MHMVCCRDSCLLIADLVAGKTGVKMWRKPINTALFSYFLPFYNTLTTKATRFYKKKSKVRITSQTIVYRFLRSVAGLRCQYPLSGIFYGGSLWRKAKIKKCSLL